jgi:hypothetical protein
LGCEGRQARTTRRRVLALCDVAIFATTASVRGVVRRRFVTTWCLDAPIGRVFEAIDDGGRWPQWWKGVTRAEPVEPGDPDGVGRLWRYTWRSRLP